MNLRIGLQGDGAAERGPPLSLYRAQAFEFKSIPLAQFPNPPLLLTLAGWLVARLSSGSAHSTGRAVFYVGLSVWAWEEVAAGVNWFRRLIGLGGLVWIVSQLAGLIPG